MPKVTPRDRAAAAAEIQRLFKAGFSRYEVGRRLNINPGTAWNIAHQRPSETKPTGVGARTAIAVKPNIIPRDPMRALREYGNVLVDPANERSRTALGRYWNAMKAAREKGDWSKLDEFRGKSIQVVEKGRRVKLVLVTDPAVLRRLENADQLDPSDIAPLSWLRRAAGVVR
jgi:hypothetical protein